MTLVTSSMLSWSIPRAPRFMECSGLPTTAPREPEGGPYTLGNNGTVAEIGLELPPVPVPVPVAVSGESGRDSPEERGTSLMRVNEYVRSSDWARFVSDLGFVNWSFSFASKSESEPRLRASSPRARDGTPEPCMFGQRRIRGAESSTNSQWGARASSNQCCATGHSSLACRNPPPPQDDRCMKARVSGACCC